MWRVLAIALACSACTKVEDFGCAQSSECTLAGVAGTCEPAGACSFPDPGCASGKRYGEFSRPELAGVCVGDEPPTDDADHDGVDDAHDNCPNAANSTQHDEDMDGKGDACDPCPPYPDVADADADGVPDACDPEAGIANHLVAFEGFGAAPAAAWSTDGSGTWSYAADDAKVVANGGGVGMLLLASPGPQAAVLTNLTIDSLDASGTRVAGVVDLFDVSGNRGTSCVAIREVTGTQLLLLSDTLTSDNFGQVAMVVQAGTAATIGSVRDGTTIKCSNDTDSVTGTALYNPGSPKLGIRARGGTVRFAWVLVIGR